MPARDTMDARAKKNDQKKIKLMKTQKQDYQVEKLKG